MINSENKVIDVDDEILNKIDIIESLCLRCGKNGITRLIIHKVPYFRELIIASFQCEECGEYNNEVTFGGEIQLQGCKYHLNLTNLADLDRQLIKSDTATIRIPSLDFEIPPMTQKGEISTIEGFIKVAVKNLSLYQEERMKQTPEIGLKVQEIINVLEEMATGNRFPFEIELDDPSGNSFIQNPYVPNKDPNMRVGFYYRTPQQDMELGLNPEKGIYRDDKDSNFKSLITGPGFGTARSNTVAIPVEEEIKTKEEESDAYSSHIEETDTTVKLGRSEVRNFTFILY
jgi:zinc finger protein